MAGIDSGLISLLQLIPTLILLVGVFLLTDIELSDVVPGANDNASGVATVLSLAEELDANPPANLDVWVLLTGAEECLQEGMRAFVRAHRGELDRETTYFVNVDTVGHGERPLRGRRRMGRQLSRWTGAWSSSATRSPTADREDSATATRRGRWSHGLAGDALPPRLAASPRRRSPASNDAELRPAATTRLDDIPDRDRPGRARPRPRLRARAGAGARPRRRPPRSRR